MNLLIKCSSCPRDYHPNQLVTVQGRTKEGTVKQYKLCPDCEKELNIRIGNNEFLAGLIRGVLGCGEIIRLRKERAHEWAIAGYPAHKQITHLEEGVA